MLRVFNYSQNAFIKTGAAAAQKPSSLLLGTHVNRVVTFSLLFFFTPALTHLSLKAPFDLIRWKHEKELGFVLMFLVELIADILRYSAETASNLSTFFFYPHFGKKKKQCFRS